MGTYFRRLASTGAAYTASSVLSKLLAVALLPLYTEHLSPADYGAAEVFLVAVIAASIAIRLGVIEALLRFYYQAEEDRTRLVRSSFAALFWTASAGALLALPFAEPISEALIDQPAADLARISAFGLWAFTIYELLLALFRLDERARAYLIATVANVLLTIALTIWLVVIEDEGARGLLLANFSGTAALTVVLAWVHRRRLGLVPNRDVLRRMYRFGLPTMPAELSLYALSFIDRILLVRLAGLAEAGLYAVAVKFAQGVNVLVRGFQLAWPPLAYSIADDEEARPVYARIVTWFLALCAFAVTGLWLLAPWVARLLTAPEFFDSYEAVGLVASGVTLYALYLVLVVVLGRTGRTEFAFPATAAGAAANIALNLILIPPYGIVGAGVALVASYVVVIGVMLFFTQRLFHVPYEWGRIGHAILVAAVLIAAGTLLLPISGAGALAGRLGLGLAYPVLLWLTRFPSASERAEIRRLLRPGELAATLSRAATPPPPPAEDRH